MKNIPPVMRKNWQEISELSLQINPAIKLPSLNVIGIIDDYCNFLRALTYCKKIAFQEYEFIVGETLELIKLREKLNKIQNELSIVKVHDDIKIDEEGEKSQREFLESLQRTTNEFSNDLLKSIKEIRDKIDTFGTDLQEFKIVLFGRTKVGKSTVREALTKGNGKTIGKGGQSTTIEINKYSWYNLTVYDTPGILSVKDTHLDQDGIGREEREAFELLEKADIALFMFASDNIEEAELAYLKKICERGREVIVLLNVKQDVSNYRNFLLRKQDKMISIDKQKGHIDRIKSAVPEHSIKILPIHAQAAFFSRAENNDSIADFYNNFEVRKTDLYQLSKFGDIRNTLVQNIVEKGAAIRCQTIREYFIYQLNTFAERNKKPIEKTIENGVEIYRKIIKTKESIQNRCQRFEDSLYGQILTEAKVEIDVNEFATRCITNKYDKDSIQCSWSDLVKEKLPGIPYRILEDFVKEIIRQLEELARQIDFQLSQAESFAGYEAYSLPWSDVFKVGGIAVGVAGGLLTTAAAIGLIPGVGWAGAGIALFGAALAGIAGFFQSETTKIRKLEEKLNSSLETCVNEIAEQMIAHCNSKIMPAIFDKLDSMVDLQNQLIHIAGEFKKLNGCLFELSQNNQMLMNERLSILGGKK
ncbi:MAG: GTPase domain-containing protein [Lentisphaeria bacterium]|jgi:GTP-binding protein EngB required for normal cell division